MWVEFGVGSGLVPRCFSLSSYFFAPNGGDFLYSQNYNKILERDWLSAARFEH